MNSKEAELHNILERTVQCCCKHGLMVSCADVLGDSKNAVVVKARCIVTNRLLAAGFTTTTVAMFLKRSRHQIRKILSSDIGFKNRDGIYRMISVMLN